MQIVCVHGWSDCSASMVDIAESLKAKLKLPVTALFLGDYSSLDDELTFDDLAAAMMNAWQQEKLSLQPKSVHIILHSMGALVFRYWLQKYFTAKTNPIKNCVMLAPANFGSPLAHKGQALLGRIFKGHQHQRPFDVGIKLLKNLELGSPFIWQQAQQDCFNQPMFNEENILTTILIGTSGNFGLASLLNEPSSDGVIRWSGANLCPIYYKIDFSQKKLQVTRKESKNNTAFKLIKNCNHHSILDVKDDSKQILSSIIKGLTVNKDNFSSWSNLCGIENTKLLSKTSIPQYQQCLVKTHNQYQQEVKDWCMIACEEQQDQHELTDYFQSKVQKNTHIYNDNSAYKCFYWNIKKFWQSPTAWQKLHFSFVAHPQFNPPAAEVGYLSYDDIHQPAWLLNKKDLTKLMLGQTSVFFEVVLPKQQQNIFGFNNEK